MALKNIQFTMSVPKDSDVGRFLGQFTGKSRTAMVTMALDWYLKNAGISTVVQVPAPAPAPAPAVLPVPVSVPVFKTPTVPSAATVPSGKDLVERAVQGEIKEDISTPAAASCSANISELL